MDSTSTTARHSNEGWPLEGKLPSLLIRPTRGWAALELKEIWEYRELLYFLVWRDLKVRYKQTALGAAWVVIQPFFMMLIFSLVFGRLAKIPSDGIPYPIFVYSALLPWQLFAQALFGSSNSLVANQHIITKVYFPRLVVPIAEVLVRLADFGIAFVLLLGMMGYYGIVPNWWAVFAVPLFVLLAVMTALGVGLWLSGLNVRYRDVGHTLGFLVQFWMFATPVVYPSSLVPGAWRIVYGLNPMVGVIEGFRWALLGKAAPGAMLAVSVSIVILIFISGLYYFKRTEKIFADVI